MIPGDRLLCALIEPFETGDRFKTWPLHVTIIPWFRLADAPEAIAVGLQKALSAIHPFEAAAQGSALFGPRKRYVALLKEPTTLTEVECKARTYLHKKRAWLVDETTTKRYEFRPHVTAQGDKSLQDGDNFTVDRLYIIEQKGDYKKVASTIRLSGE